VPNGSLSIDNVKLSLILVLVNAMINHLKLSGNCMHQLLYQSVIRRLVFMCFIWLSV
jgi:hypothetical protein